MRPDRDYLKGRAYCDCVGYYKGTKPNSKKSKPHVCPHHNHLICCPLSSLEWDYVNNEPLRPEDISPGANKEYSWICANSGCRRVYMQRPYTRVGKTGSRCPYCSGNKVSSTNNLEANFPEVVNNWDYQANYPLTPKDILPHSNAKYWWVCNRQHCEGVLSPYKYKKTLRHKTKADGRCPECLKYDNLQMYGKEAFLKRAREIHGDKYTYFDDFVNLSIKIAIHCPQVGKNGDLHGIFMKMPYHHTGQRQGCPKCSSATRTSRMVEDIYQFLKELGYREGQTMVSEWRDPGKLKDHHNLRIDILLVREDLLIEIDGAQHFQEYSFGGQTSGFIDGLRRDIIKDKYAIENLKSLIRIPYRMKNVREYLINAIMLRRQNYLLYFSYKHYYDFVSTITKFHPHTYIQIIKCPPIRCKQLT